MPDGKTILSWELSIVLNEFKSFLLIFGSDDMIYLTIAIFRWFSNHWMQWLGAPSCSMVFGWFLGPPTIGQTMRCDGPSSSLNCSISIVLCVGGSKFICLFALILFSVEQKQSAASAKSRVLRDTSYILVKLPFEDYFLGNIFWPTHSKNCK